MTASTDRNVARLYPELGAGGFTHVDGTVDFYSRVNALLEPHFTVMDLGAGRGGQLLENPGSWKTQLCIIHGKVAKVIGADIDDAVLHNPFLDEAKVIAIGEPWPFPDNSFDLIVADWVLEHVTNPEEFAAEARRVLKPGGWLCARTPNRWGMIGIGANLIPNRLHTKFLARLQPERQEIDVFPTAYRLNTKGVLGRYFKRGEWNDFSYVSNAEPPYVQRSRLAMRLVRLYWRLTPSSLHTVLNVFVQLR